MQRGGLTNDWADTVRSHDAPDEEGDSGSWRDYGLEGEKVPAKISVNHNAEGALRT